MSKRPQAEAPACVPYAAGGGLCSRLSRRMRLSPRFWMRISNCTQKEAGYQSAQIQARHLPGSSLPDQFRAAKSCVQMKILIQVRPLCVPHTPRHRRQAHGSMQVRPQIQAAGCQSALQAGHHASRLWATMLMPGIWARRLRDLRPGGGLGAGGREAAPVVHLLTLAIRMSREEPRRRSPRFGDGLGEGGPRGRSRPPAGACRQGIGGGPQRRSPRLAGGGPGEGEPHEAAPTAC